MPDRKLFYKIGEVSRIAGVEAYVLRYWESVFPALSPRKNRGGQRVYLRRDLDLVLRLKRMLHEEGYTIAGAKKKLEDERAARGGKAAGGPSEAQPDASTGAGGKDITDALGRLKGEIREILEIIKD